MPRTRHQKVTEKERWVPNHYSISLKHPLLLVNPQQSLCQFDVSSSRVVVIIGQWEMVLRQSIGFLHTLSVLSELRLDQLSLLVPSLQFS